jgi:hypothetical protein
MNKRKKNCSPALVTMTVLLFVMNSFVLARAQSSPADSSLRQEGSEGAVKLPQLGRHTFVPSDYVPGPFIQTYIRNALGYAQSVELTAPPITIAGETVGGLKGDLLFAVLEFEYQHAVKEWLAVNAQIHALSRLGTETQSLLFQGVTAAAGFKLGWLFKLWRNDRMLLSGAMDVMNNSVTIIDLAQYIEGIIAAGGLTPDNKLVNVTPSVRGGGGLRWAYGVSQLVGLTFSVEGSYGESMTLRTGNQWYLDLGGAASLDLYAKHGIPLGFVIGFRQASVASLGGDLDDKARNGILRISYTGRKDFSVGMESYFQSARPNNLEKPVRSMGTVVTMRYYF